MHKELKIDWPTCRREFIDANHPDLPPSIRVMQANKMDGATLAQAMEYCTGPVQVVQIEVPFSEVGKEAARRLPDVCGLNLHIIDSDDDIEGTTLNLKTTFSDSAICLSGFIDEQFDARPDIDVRAEGRKALVDRYGNMVDAMQVNDLEASQNTIFISAVSHQPTMNFHRHRVGIKPGWYLTAPMADDASIFTDSRDIDQTRLDRVVFTNSTPIIWQGKSWSYFLFTAGNQPQGSAAHTHPITTLGRATSIIGFNRKTYGLDQG